MTVTLDDATIKRLEELVAKTKSDASLKKRFETDPVDVLKEFGIPIGKEVPPEFRAEAEMRVQSRNPVELLKAAEKAMSEEEGTIVNPRGHIVIGSGAEWRDIPYKELTDNNGANPPDSDIPARLRAAFNWAIAHGYVGAFPNSQIGENNVRGHILLKQTGAFWRDISQAMLIDNATGQNPEWSGKRIMANEPTKGLF